MPRASRDSAQASRNDSEGNRGTPSCLFKFADLTNHLDSDFPGDYVLGELQLCFRHFKVKFYQPEPHLSVIACRLKTMR
jgi:hypothetical protein